MTFTIPPTHHQHEMPGHPNICRPHAQSIHGLPSPLPADPCQWPHHRARKRMRMERRAHDRQFQHHGGGRYTGGGGWRHAQLSDDDVADEDPAMAWRALQVSEGGWLAGVFPWLVGWCWPVGWLAGWLAESHLMPSMCFENVTCVHGVRVPCRWVMWHVTSPKG